MTRWGTPAIRLGVRGLRKQMAFAVELGVNESTVSRWQRGYGLSVANLVRVCEALDLHRLAATGRGGMQLDRSGASGPSDQRLEDACAGLPEGWWSNSARRPRRSRRRSSSAADGRCSGIYCETNHSVRSGSVPLKIRPNVLVSPSIVKETRYFISSSSGW